MIVTRRQKANAIRALTMDAVQQANSGHPGMPMGMADIAEVLWSDFLKQNPVDPDWVDRDRFIVSNGHGSMLLYALLHLSGYDLSMEDLKQFRQLHSKTPGHPEFGCTPGVETTTGPLGQGLSNAVGMAIAEKTLAAEFNRDGYEVIDHHTYVFVGDGCLMEGISHEACSLAGTLGLGKLIVVYDDNGISIDGEVQAWFTDDTPKRFEAYGWHVVAGIEGHDGAAVFNAIADARGETEKPSLLCCKTVIGFGSPNKEGKESSHGAPLGEEEIVAAKQQLGWSSAPFEVPPEIYDAWNMERRGESAQRKWDDLFSGYSQHHPELADAFTARMVGGLPGDWRSWMSSVVAELDTASDSTATRKSSQIVLNKLASKLPGLIGGSADLAGSNLTNWVGSNPMCKADPAARYIHFGVREFAMAAITNGIALHKGCVPFCATFLIFSEYARNALRMAALMKIRSIFVFTHDSIGVGEDGPTHQPVEQLATLRLIPNMSVWRPCDMVESAVAWQSAVERVEGPTSLLFTRQSVPHMARDSEQIENISRGGYILRDCTGTPDAILIATGSEVALAVCAAEALERENYLVRTVSMPSVDTFECQPGEYRESVLPRDAAVRVAVEAGVMDGWRKYVGLDGAVIGMNSFGESAPAAELYKHFGITAGDIVEAVRTTIDRTRGRLPEVAVS